jgi:hypothetical protein
MADKVRYPFGAADALSLTATGAQALSIDNQMTIVDGVTTEASGNRTINLTVNSLVKAGAIIFIKLKTNGTETTAFGTTMSGATLTGAAGKTKTVVFVYDGTNFVESGTPVQID